MNGIFFALLGASIATALAGVGSARGVGSWTALSAEISKSKYSCPPEPVPRRSNLRPDNLWS